jgi:hypothetical protein
MWVWLIVGAVGGSFVNEVLSRTRAFGGYPITDESFLLHATHAQISELRVALDRGWFVLPAQSILALVKVQDRELFDSFFRYVKHRFKFQFTSIPSVHADFLNLTYEHCRARAETGDWSFAKALLSEEGAVGRELADVALRVAVALENSDMRTLAP